MCGRFTLADISVDSIKQLFAVERIPDVQIIPRYNIAPTQPVPLVRESTALGARELASIKWGFIPVWAKEASGSRPLINARAEGIAEKPTFRSAFKTRRGLIVSDGFFEWDKIGPAKQPYYIQMGDESLFGMAALWETYRRGEEELETCAIITTTANELMSKLHDRMPVILDPSSFDAWLDPGNSDTEALTSLLLPYPADEMMIYPVSRVVNSAANDTPECIERYEPQPTLL